MATRLNQYQAALLQRFADATHVEMRWLLTGEGPVRSTYPPEQPTLVLLAREVAALDGDLPEQAERVLRALLPQLPTH